MEGDALTGAQATIARCRPLLYVEADRQDKRAALEAQLDGLGYRLYAHHPPLFSPDNYRRHMENHFEGIVSINLLAVPREDPLDYAAIYPVLRPVTVGQVTLEAKAA
jgi:hypothetical protein